MIKELEFKGKSFKIEYVETYATHPTWYSFEDEKDVREAFWNPKEGEVVLDVGACCGSYTLPALAHRAFVLAWAPGKLHEGTREFEILMQNARINGWVVNSRASDLTVFPSGLYDRYGILDVTKQSFRSDVEGESSFIGPDEIQVWSFDSLWTASDGPVHWIKIDVEGAELNVLKGAEQTIKRYHPKILVECHLFVRPTMAIEVTDYLVGEIGGYGVRKEPIKHPASDVIHVLYEPT